MKAVQGIRACLHVLRRLPGLLLLADIEGLALIVGAPPHVVVLIPIAVLRPSVDSDNPLVHFVAGTLLAGSVVIAFSTSTTIRRGFFGGIGGLQVG